MEILVFIVLILLIPLLLFIFVAVWMYGDANSRGMSGGLWVALLLIASLLGSFVGGLVVLVIYLLVREGHLAPGYPYRYGYPPYPPPGYPWAPSAPPPAGAQGRCARCGAATNPGARYCASCGAAL